MIGFFRCHGRTLAIVGLLVLVLLTRCALPVDAQAATINPPCGTYPATPPLLFVLPDGTEVPASGAVYDIAALRIQIIGYDRIFCDGFEVRG